jgi:hypothetical protein
VDLHVEDRDTETVIAEPLLATKKWRFASPRHLLPVWYLYPFPTWLHLHATLDLPMLQTKQRASRAQVVLKLVVELGRRWRRVVVDDEPHDDERKAHKVEAAEVLVEKVLGRDDRKEVGREQRQIEHGRVPSLHEDGRRRVHEEQRHDVAQETEYAASGPLHRRQCGAFERVRLKGTDDEPKATDHAEELNAAVLLLDEVFLADVGAGVDGAAQQTEEVAKERRRE